MGTAILAQHCCVQISGINVTQSVAQPKLQEKLHCVCTELTFCAILSMLSFTNKETEAVRHSIIVSSKWQS